LKYPDSTSEYQRYFNLIFNFIAIADPTNSVIYISSVSITTLDVYSVSIQAYDHSGQAILTGGELFYLHLSNKCNWSSDFVCTLDSVAPVMDKDEYVKMEDHNNGTYSHNISILKEGEATISVVLYSKNTVKMTYFQDDIQKYQDYHSNIDFQWARGNIYVIYQPFPSKPQFFSR